MSAPGTGFRHSALLYDDDRQLLAGLRTFAEGAVERDEALLVAMPSRSLEVAAAAIDVERLLTSFVDLDRLGRNPARLISTWKEFTDSKAEDAGGFRLISENLWFGRTVDEIGECERHEAALNLGFGESKTCSFLCPYDRGRLAPEVIARVGHSHRELSEAGRAPQPSESFAEATEAELLGGRLEEVEVPFRELGFRKSDLAEVRAFVGTIAGEAGLEQVRREDFVLAADELATNSIRHGGGGGTMRVWRTDDLVQCEVRDAGRIEDPMVGRLRPGMDQVGGRGLWLANQLCDLVQIRSGAEGTAVRLTMQLG